MIDLPYRWKPRDYQAEAWDALSKLTLPNSKTKRVGLCWHRRAGKDELMLHHNACAAIERVGNYWYLLPEYNQCRKAIWNGINPNSGKKRIDEAFPHEIRSKTLENEMLIEFKNGSTWQLMGSDNYNSLVGAPPVGITWSEFQLSNPNSFEYLSPILLENNGWGIINGTPRGKNHFYKTLQYGINEPDWFVQTLTVNETSVFSQEKLLSELRRLQAIHGDDYGKAIWLQEYHCSFDAAIPGAIWGDSLTRIQDEGRLCSVPHTEGYPVFTSWDIGRADMTAVWFFQIVGNLIHIIDYWADNFKEIEDMTKMLSEKATERKYQFGVNWLPHDAKPIRLGMGGKGVIQQFMDQKREYKETKDIHIGDFRLVPGIGREDGIQAARKTFQFCKFDKDYCGIGFEHLKSYHREYDNEKKIFSLTPQHDEASHPADSFRYLSLVWRFSRDEQVILTPNQKLLAGNITNMSFGEIKKRHFEKKRRERGSMM